MNKGMQGSIEKRESKTLLATALLLPIFVMLHLPTAAIGASFDCRLASTAVERSVCSNRELSELDDALSEIFTLEIERSKTPFELRASQKAWLLARGRCAEVACVKQQYERRIAELSCDARSATAGSAIGASRCAYYSLQVLERELSQLEERYGQSISEKSNNSEFTIRTFKAERDTWRRYREDQCALYGATEGGSDGWKNAFSSMCEVDETKKRIARLKNELGAK